MQLGTRKIIDKSFSSLGYFSIAFVAAALLVILVPIFSKGITAFVFKGTVEYRKMTLELFGRGDPEKIAKEYQEAAAVREPVYAMLDRFESELEALPSRKKRELSRAFKEVRKGVDQLLGPRPGERRPILTRERYGQTRWDRARVKIDAILFAKEWDYSDPSTMGRQVLVPRSKQFEGTSLVNLFAYIEENKEDLLRPRWTFYWRFLTDNPVDSNIFGGIWPALLGTLYLTIGAVLFAVPIGIVSAIFLIEYSNEGLLVRVLRTFVSTLAGVPSIVFGLFGLAFFINTMHVSHSKSVLAGSLTLAILILPVIIRSSEEAIKAVPHTYKEAALSLGAGKWRTVVQIILPAALPGILTGTIISMGRAAGETAPIIFTAAVSAGPALKIWEVFSQPTPALPWNIYNLATEHEAIEEIRHVQYGMVLTLVLLVLALNLLAIVLRARIVKKLRG